MAGRFALIIGNSHYDDPGLGRLRAPDLDVQGLEGVLKAPDVGHFDKVTTLLNEGCASVRKAVARFYDQRRRDDLLLLYFSGHGVKDEQGHLYLALRDTESGLLAGTAMETAFITGRMDRSFSKRQVLVLDCCHSGAFAHGAKAAQGVSVGTAEAFEGTGLGRVILTATDSTQYAWEGDQIIGDAQNSLFTHFLIDGLKTGAADRDDDGVVTVDELYDYVREQVVSTTPRQTPHKWAYRQEGEIVLAQNPFVKRSLLPPEIEEAKSSKLSSLRLEAVRDLETLLRGHHIGRARAALVALKDLSVDDSRKVATAAVKVLKDRDEEERRGLVGPHLTAARAAIERKQFEQALDSLRQASALDAEADGLAELVRIAEEGRAEIQHAVAPEAAVRDAESPATADDPLDADPPDIFISYAHEDREKARALANVLAARGWNVWWDRKIAPGEAFDVVIERELGTCKCAIVLWSAHSVGATWVRNEARRAARRKVLVPILIDPVETPLEFENLQAADLTSWEAAAENPEFAAVLDRIHELSPIPNERLARSAVEDARRDFRAGRRQEAIASLEQFRPAHVVVSRALTALRADAERIEQERAETVRREAEAAQRRRDLAAETARHAVDHARHEFDDGRHQAALATLEQFRPAHDLVTRALAELRAEAERIERERAEAARREAEAAQRQQELGTGKASIEEIVEQGDLNAAEQAVATAEKESESPPEVRPVREQSEGNRQQASLDARVAAHARLRTLSRSTSRPVRVGAALLALIVGTWLVGVWPGRTPDGPRDLSQHQNQLPESPTPVSVPSPRARTPAVENASVSPQMETPAPKPTAIEIVQPAPGAVPDNGVPNERAERPATDLASTSKRLEELRTRARSQGQSGQRAQALSTVVEGLQIAPRDSVLRSILDSLLREAQAGAERSKQEAVELDASARAEEAFSRGLQAERGAVRLRRAGRIDAATRSFWGAADEFTTAAAESRRIADAEEAEARLAAEQARANKNKENERVDAQRQRRTADDPAERKSPNAAIEQDLVEQTLHRYEAAYASLSVDSVRSVYPTAPIDELAKDFAGCQSYTLKVRVDEYKFVFTETLTGAIVTARVIHDFLPTSGRRTQFERPQTLQLEKQRNTWIIKQIR